MVSSTGEVQGYTIDPDGTGSSNAFAFGKPDFNYRSLRETPYCDGNILPAQLFF